LLYYPDRTGKSGSFEVHFPDFIDPNKNITDISHLFEGEYSKCILPLSNPTKSEVSTEVKEDFQRLEKTKNEDITNRHLLRANKQFRGYNNDTETQNEIENTDISVSYKDGEKGALHAEYVCKNITDSYNPIGYEERTAKEIALKVGDKCMDRYLALIREKKFWVLEKAFGEYSEGEVKGNNPPAYLNRIICRMLKEQVGSKLK